MALVFDKTIYLIGNVIFSSNVISTELVNTFTQLRKTGVRVKKWAVEQKISDPVYPDCYMIAVEM